MLDKLVEAYSIVFRTRVQFPPSPFISFFPYTLNIILKKHYKFRRRVYYLKRPIGIEPTSLAWKAKVIAIIRRTQDNTLLI